VADLQGFDGALGPAAEESRRLDAERPLQDDHRATAVAELKRRRLGRGGRGCRGRNGEDGEHSGHREGNTSTHAIS
jgi:hypothetical protein